MAVTDDAITDRPKDLISYHFTPSIQRAGWGIFGGEAKNFTVKEMVEFLKRREPTEIAEADILMHAAQNFKYASLTEGNFSYTNNGNFVEAIKVKNAEGTVMVPETITVNLEIFKGSGRTCQVEVEVEPQRLSVANDNPGYQPGLSRIQTSIKDLNDHRMRPRRA